MTVILLILKKNMFQHFASGALLGCIFAFTNLIQIIGLSLTDASNSGFFTGLFVVFTPIIAFIINKKSIQRNEILATIISIIGLWIFTGGFITFNMGDLLSLISGAMYASYFFVASHAIKKKANPLVLNQQVFLTSTIIIAIASLMTGSSFQIEKVYNFWFQWLYIVVFVTILPFFFIIWAQEHTTPVKTSFILSLEMIFAALFAWTIGNEAITNSKIIGGSFFFLSVLLSQNISFRSHRKSNAL